MIEEKNIENLDIVRLNIQLTKKCNQRCKSCNSYMFSTEDEMSTDVIISAMKDICRHFSINNIALTGGEPTVHKDILQIAQMAKKYSPNVSITTNGFYCTTKERVRELIDSGINRFSFSYHGVGMQDTFTGVQGSEARIRKAIEWVCEERQNNPDIYVKIGTLFDGNNIENVGKVLNYAEDVGVDLYIELLDDQLPIFKNTELNKTIPRGGYKRSTEYN